MAAAGKLAGARRAGARRAGVDDGSEFMKRTILAALTVLALAVPVARQAHAESFDVQAEIRAALEAIEKAHANLGGMGGLGVIPEPDLKTIQDMLGEAESLVREARRRAQGRPAPHEAAWVVGYARAGKAFAEAADAFRVNQGYR
jgi:hypothetical protein